MTTTVFSHLKTDYSSTVISFVMHDHLGLQYLKTDYSPTVISFVMHDHYGLQSSVDWLQHNSPLICYAWPLQSSVTLRLITAQQSFHLLCMHDHYGLQSSVDWLQHNSPLICYAWPLRSSVTETDHSTKVVSSSPNIRRLCIIIILDLALAAPRILPVGPRARKSLSRISIPSGLYNYIF